MDISSIIKVMNTVVTVAKPILEVVTPKLQESMKDFSERLLALSVKYPSLEEYVQMIDKAADILGDVLFALGIISDPADVLGVKVATSDKQISDFESIEAYITYLKNEVEMDKDKYDSLSTQERVAYSITGMAVEAGAISEKLGVEIPADAVELVTKIAEIGKVVLQAKEMVEVLLGLKDEGITNLNDICECIYGQGESDRLKTGEAIVKNLDRVSPGNGDNMLNEIQDELRG